MVGVFDSGYGGLTILDEFLKLLPQYDYLYLGDNARAPYGTRSFNTVYRYTRTCVRYLYEQGCQLVILACNTASAKALRTIQQRDIPGWDPRFRVLGVIRPMAEAVAGCTKTGHVGVLGTQGTVLSDSYPIEINKLWPDLKVTQVACPMWVPLVENGEYDSPGADYFVQKYLEELLSRDPAIDTVVLGCTHYPLLMHKIVKYLPAGVRVLSQGEIVSQRLQDYLQRHVDLERRLSRGGTCRYVTTDDVDAFARHAQHFMGRPVTAACWSGEGLS